MAVTPTTMTELNDLAKDYYSNVYQPLMNSEVPLKAQFARLENAMFTGRKWIFGVKTSVGGGAANAGANKSLPQAAAGQYDQGEATLVRTYTRMALDNMAIEVTKKREGSYRPALAEEMADRLEAHDLEVNRQLFCGGNGKLTTIQTGATSATQTLGVDYGVTNGGAGSRHVYIGDQYAVYSSDGVTNRGTRTVVSVDQAANTVTFDSSIATTTSDFLARATADTDNKTAGEALGLLASVTDSGAAFETIPTAGRWKAYRNANGGTVRPLTDSLAMQTIATVRARSRKLPNLAVTRGGVVLKYSESFLPLRRIMGQDVELKGGYKPISGIQHAGGVIPVLEDNDCPDSRVFFLNTESFRLADLIGSDWFDGDGAQFTRITDKDGIEGFIRKYWNLITIARNQNAVIEDVDDLSTVDRIAA